MAPVEDRAIDRTMFADEQRLSVSAMVSLVEIDARAIGGRQVFVVTGPMDGARVGFKGRSYRPVPVEIAGVGGGDRRGGATLEIADIALDNPGGAGELYLSMLLGMELEDIAGATVRQIRTLRDYLEGQPGHDSDRHWPEERWRVQSLLRRDQARIAWRLASPLTADGAQVPRRQVLQGVCSFSYRRWVPPVGGEEPQPGRWDHDGVDCPYRGDRLFNSSDEPVTDEAEDRCSRHIHGCELRFGTNAAVGFGGFVGVGRTP